MKGMDFDYFRREQRAGVNYCVHSLFTNCQTKFVNAANLLELQSPILDALRKDATPVADLGVLRGVYSLICQKYINEIFSPQLDMINQLAYIEDKKWIRCYYQKIIPRLISDNDFVLNVLRATKVIPCKDPRAAADALLHHVNESSLISTTHIWRSDTYC